MFGINADLEQTMARLYLTSETEEPQIVEIFIKMSLRVFVKMAIL